jgi:curved DNA-binding protein CbpA
VAVKLNPDKLPDEELESAIQTFSLLNDAYKALSDNETRAVYDKHGRRGLEALKRGLDPDKEGSGRSIDDDDDLNRSNKLIAKLGSTTFPSSSSKHLWLVLFCRNGSDLDTLSKLGLDGLAKKMKGAYKIGAAGITARHWTSSRPSPLSWRAWSIGVTRVSSFRSPRA